MMRPTFRHILAALVLLGLLAAVTPQAAFAATRTLSGNTGDGCDVNDPWTDTNCWTGGIVPVTGDDVVLAGASQGDTTYDLGAGVQLLSITVNDGGDKTILGGPIVLQSGGSITSNNCGGVSGPDSFPGITLNGPATFTRSNCGGPADSMEFDGAITGTGPLTLTNDNPFSSITLTTVNTYTGATTVSGVEVVIFEVNGAVPIGSALTVNGEVIFETDSTVGSLAGSGDVFMNGNALTVGGDNSDTTFSGRYRDNFGSVSLVKTGTGTLTLSGANTYTGSTTVSGATLLVTGSLDSDVTVESGATLGGSGTINGDVTLDSGATLDSNSTLDFTGTVTNNGTIEIDCDGEITDTITGNQPVNICDDPVIDDEFSCEFFLSAGSAEWSVDICTIDVDLTVDSGDSLTIASGVILIIDTGTVLTVDGTLNINDGEITNNGDIVNSGTINNNDFIGNNADITNNIGGTFNSNDLDNRGTLTNDGTLNNTGFLTNNLFATLTNDGTITNTGEISNSNILDNTGTITNNGTLSNSGELTNNGTISNLDSSTLSNSGTLTNDGTFDNDGSITNLDTIENTGTFDNDGSITNLGGIIDNNFGGTLTNNGTISNNGDITNDGTITNTGTIINSGTISNTGTITNNERIENDCDGSISGTITGTVVDTCPDEEDDDRSGGGGSKRVVIVNQDGTSVEIFPESHFAEHPLDRIQMSHFAFLDAAGAIISQANVGQQLSITGTFANHQEVEQDYAFIVQITDEDSSVVHVSWQQGTIESGQTADVSTTWTPMEGGSYNVQVFVWDGLGAAPTPLSTVTISNVEVTQ
jgi:autotransporter-associated beta strand protein